MAPTPPDTTGLGDSFLRQVERQPHAVALLWNDEAVTYGELSAMTEHERGRLDRMDLADGEPVGVVATKSPPAIAIVLACVLSGRRFLLPSPSLPERLLHALFEQAGCRRTVSPAPGHGLPGDRATPCRAADRAVAADVSFMLTTSGSTGTPKIVPLRQPAIDRFIAWAGPQFDIRPGTTVLNYAPLNFDLCLLDVWTTLAHGGRVVLVDPDRATNGRHLLDLIARHSVDVIQAVPMLYRLLVDAAGPAGTGTLESVAHVIFTGDVMPERTLAALPSLFTKARLYNIYGCTETNDSFIHRLDRSTPMAPVPLGQPLPGVRFLLVDPEGLVVDGPGAGELLVATPFQTDGYLDAARNAGKFTGHPTGAGGVRYFRSGDIVRRDERGRLLLEGRSDHQVKVRGVAVNTAQVERVLLQHPAVVEAAVVAVPDVLAGRRLCCFVQRRPGSKLNSLALRQHCAQRLPSAAVPSAMEIVDDPLPKTSTGKIDHRRVEGAHPALAQTDR